MNAEYAIIFLSAIFLSVEGNVLLDTAEDTTYNFQTTWEASDTTFDFQTTSEPRTTDFDTTINFITTHEQTTWEPTELTTTTPPSGYSCIPETDCSRSEVGASVPDPLDCERYYVCINVDGNTVPASSPSSCPQGQYFNGTIGGCIPETSPGICTSTCGENVCSVTCPTSPSTTTVVADSSDCSIYTICLSSGASIPSVCPSDASYFNGISCVSDASQCCSCRPFCTAPGIEIQDPCGCSSYYICAAVGQPHDNNRGTCPPGNYFDESLAGCVTGNCVNSCSTCS